MNQHNTDKLPVSAEILGLSAWMIANSVRNLFVGDCYCCEWTKHSGEIVNCGISYNMPPAIKTIWAEVQDPFVAATLMVLQARYPMGHFDRNEQQIFVSDMEIMQDSIRRAEWSAKLRVWYLFFKSPLYESVTEGYVTFSFRPRETVRVEWGYVN